jgi:S-adenosylmethionine:tRNA ribosyltransferase-isomerase
MRVDDFDFHLPADRIALRPAAPRDASRLLVVDPSAGSAMADRFFRDLGRYLRPGDALVFNDTRVLHAQLEGWRERDGRRAAIGATLHKRTGPGRFAAFVRGAGKLRTGDRVTFGGSGEACLPGRLDATVATVGAEGEIEFAFDLSGPALDEAVEAAGTMPLPPYIASRRAADIRDETDYQTVFASKSGAVAAPTAGLHFTDALIGQLAAAGVSIHRVTLHVGAGTFRPVHAADTKDHAMHAETGVIDEETASALNAARRAGGRIVCVGTTSLRLLESAADERGQIRPFAGDTAIFITPGYRFRACDLLVTNFHLPRSTLFMLVSAFAGTATMQAAYAHAIAAGYRFYSYGDACLIYPAR